MTGDRWREMRSIRHESGIHGTSCTKNAESGIYGKLTPGHHRASRGGSGVLRAAGEGGQRAEAHAACRCDSLIPPRRRPSVEEEAAIRRARKMRSGMKGEQGFDVDRRVGEAMRHHDTFRSILVRHALAWRLALLRSRRVLPDGRPYADVAPSAVKEFASCFVAVSQPLRCWPSHCSHPLLRARKGDFRAGRYRCTFPSRSPVPAI
jgi:hypothetical protein